MLTLLILSDLYNDISSKKISNLNTKNGCSECSQCINNGILLLYYIISYHIECSPMRN